MGSNGNIAAITAGNTVAVQSGSDDKWDGRLTWCIAASAMLPALPPYSYAAVCDRDKERRRQTFSLSLSHFSAKVIVSRAEW